jgi:hypothetical protein
VRKCKSAIAAPDLVLEKASEKWKHRGGSSHSGIQTSMQELALAKPVKASKKIVAQSSRLSIAKKTYPADAKVVRKGCPLPPQAGAMRPRLRLVR